VWSGTPKRKKRKSPREEHPEYGLPPISGGIDEPKTKECQAPIDGHLIATTIQEVAYTNAFLVSMVVGEPQRGEDHRQPSDSHGPKAHHAPIDQIEIFHGDEYTSRISGAE